MAALAPISVARHWTPDLVEGAKKVGSEELHTT